MYGVVLTFLRNWSNISLAFQDVLETSMLRHFFKAVVYFCIISVITYFRLIVFM